MIHEIGKELDARLKSRGVPLRVVDGPERGKPTTGARERIVIEHDTKAKDVFGPARSQRPNGKHVATRRMACKITVYAQSGVAGGKDFEHRRRAESVVDQIVVGLHEVAKARKNEWTPTGGAFVEAEDLKGSEVIAGAVYELTFLFDRGVEERDWDGDLRPTASPPLASTTKVTLAGGPDDQTVETGCAAAEE